MQKINRLAMVSFPASAGAGGEFAASTGRNAGYSGFQGVSGLFLYWRFFVGEYKNLEADKKE